MRLNASRQLLRVFAPLLLFGLLIFRAMKAKATPKSQSKPIRTNNPFALIQTKPSPWLGLKTGSSGFLEFENMTLGVRAGFINLLGYISKRGLNTIAKIIPVYAPKGHGENEPSKYIELVSAFTGYAPDMKIDNAQKLKNIGRAIVRVETGTEISNLDFERGYELAAPRINKYFESLL